jgi:hypothetical protein
MEEILNNKYFQLLSFLITSARGCIDEPPLYGPLRLLDAASRVIDMMEKEKMVDEKISNIKNLILQAIDILMVDENEFIKIVDEISKELGKYIAN